MCVVTSSSCRFQRPATQGLDPKLRHCGIIVKGVICLHLVVFLCFGLLGILRLGALFFGLRGVLEIIRRLLSHVAGVVGVREKEMEREGEGVLRLVLILVRVHVHHVPF